MEDEERVEYWIEMAMNLEALFIVRASYRRSGQCVVAMRFLWLLSSTEVFSRPGDISMSNSIIMSK